MLTDTRTGGVPTEGSTDRQTDRQTDEMDRQTDRQKRKQHFQPSVAWPSAIWLGGDDKAKIA